ncbi:MULTISPECIES: copper chaperone PCu(A)C [unclassified Sphingobium]|uniref:copper chaperone PCu(A)C n=1 Tax=unclassified Sphingobium TaxID=2611147 RepID=UPI00222590C0|nr:MULTISPECIES: copper chaperone PCu(A)C [unclassified Sphingobium]MCW2395147.1 copper(I)-binding protein [Sphingobium sp. B8D3B]MCW2411475.1 copper(I)-binding protein [Sphingobium sp. B8D3D]MCW2416232.1 copper(I)-binding protein [Sphingobium sp. B8D3A]MCW2418661.1 copper(I)-binding protein [Sphingobium sp. B8D3C]
MHKPSSLLVAAAMLATLGACSDPPPLDVDGGFLRLNPNPNAPSAAYFTIHGGADDVVLRDVLTDEAVRVEIHESSTKDGVASMRPVKTVDVPAGATVKFEPGGKHLMLWSINPQALADKKMTFTFIFSNGQRILADAIVQQPDTEGAMTGMEDHSGH